MTERTESVGHREFREKFEDMVSLYKPDVPFMLNIAANIVYNALEGSESKEEYDYYLNAVKGSLYKIAELIGERYATE